MAIELVVPSVGESITEVEVGEWLKKPGDRVEADEAIVEIESDKATVEIFAPAAGVITEILLKTGSAAKIGDVVGRMEAGAAAVPAAKPEPKTAATPPGKPAVAAAAGEAVAMPAAQRMMDEHNVDASNVSGTGKGGRILKEDVQAHVEAQKSAPPKAAGSPAIPRGGREEEVVRMSPMRRAIARTLVKANQDMALLTTFNEIDMSAVMALRNQYKDEYAKKHGVKLGFMSFFVKACVEALKAYPVVNAEIRGDEAVYHNYYDIGIAVGGGRGLVVPVLRNAERMSFAEIESAIGDFGKRAHENKISLEELQGGTFTITNGGIYGSMMSTPIINPPQSGILGMHAIQDRAMVREGQVVARPMMYVALTYDHRIVDGKEAVSFLVKIKQCVENPARILLEV